MNSPLEVLNEVFGYPAFRGHQTEVIEHVTGGGYHRMRGRPSTGSFSIS